MLLLQIYSFSAVYTGNREHKPKSDRPNSNFFTPFPPKNYLYLWRRLGFGECTTFSLGVNLRLLGGCRREAASRRVTAATQTKPACAGLKTLSFR
jgi:hypothetical protein